MTFLEAVEHILELEGGFIAHPKDPGGSTNFGISQKSYPNLDIKNLTKSEAIKIYLRDYWLPLRLDELPEVLRLCLFDCAINQGTNVAIKFLQASVGTVVDGKIGPMTINAVKSKDATKILINILKGRQTHYTKLSTWDTFGKGWSKRLLHITILSLAPDVV